MVMILFTRLFSIIFSWKKFITFHRKQDFVPGGAFCAHDALWDMKYTFFVRRILVLEMQRDTLVLHTTPT